MNSRQGSRYIKRRMGDELKNEILVRNGIIQGTENKPKLSILNCPRCQLVNVLDNKYCSKCSYPLTILAFNEIKENEEKRFRSLEEKHSTEIQSIREEMNKKITLLIQSQNDILQVLKYPTSLMELAETKY
jgi:integrase/recombinase XerD